MQHLGRNNHAHFQSGDWQQSLHQSASDCGGTFATCRIEGDFLLIKPRPNQCWNLRSIRCIHGSAAVSVWHKNVLCCCGRSQCFAWGVRYPDWSVRIFTGVQSSALFLWRSVRNGGYRWRCGGDYPLINHSRAIGENLLRLWVVFLFDLPSKFKMGPNSRRQIAPRASRTTVRWPFGAMRTTQKLGLFWTYD